MDGKELEKLVQESCELQGVDCTRLKDAGWQGEQTQRRFTSKNICDFVIYDDGILLYAEIKHAKERLELSRLTQQDDLMKKIRKNKRGIFAGYICKIADVFVFIRADAVENFAYEFDGKKKSINRADALRIGKQILTFLPRRARKERINISALINELSYPF